MLPHGTFYLILINFNVLLTLETFTFRKYTMNFIKHKLSQYQAGMNSYRALQVKYNRVKVFRGFHGRI